MKKLLLSFMAFSLVSISCVTLAQPTLTAIGINPVSGETHTYASSAFVNPGTSGANQTWNLSSMASTSSIVENFVLPSNTTHGTSFPNSNIAWNTTSADSYYNATTTALQNLGVYNNNNGVVMSYTDPEDMIHYPFQHNNTFSDTWAAQYSYAGYTYIRSGSTTVTADSYGTLITPTGTYTDVMRVHFVQVYKDSCLNVPGLIVHYNNDEYMWYKNGIHIQIAAVATFTASNSTSIFSNGFYLTGTEGINDSPEQQLTANLYPNPANDQVSIEYSLTSNQNVDLRLINTMGQQVKTDYNAEGIQGNNTIKLDVADLPDGIYFAQLLIDGKIAATKRFIRSSKN